MTKAENLKSYLQHNETKDFQIAKLREYEKIGNLEECYLAIEKTKPEETKNCNAKKKRIIEKRLHGRHYQNRTGKVRDSMEKRYLFRGKRSDTGEWVEWNMITGIPHDVHILDNTICQCTGVEDKNGKLIFENDILEGHFDDESLEDIIRTKVVWEKNGFATIEPGSIDKESLDEFTTENYEVIGNIFDNPELPEDENEEFVTMTLRDGSVIGVQVNEKYIQVETGCYGMILSADDFMEAMREATAEGEKE